MTSAYVFGASITEERIDGATPAGGAYAVAYYLSAAGEPIDRALAERVEIVEFDAGGKEIARTYAEIGGEEGEDEGFQ